MVNMCNYAEVPDTGNGYLGKTVMAELGNGFGSSGLTEHLESLPRPGGGSGEMKERFRVRE